MTTVTTRQLGPRDHGRRLDLEEFFAGDYQGGYQYELIDGRLYVSPTADLPENYIEQWITHKFDRYQRQHPERVRYVSNKARVFVPDQVSITIPEPDLAVYREFSFNLDELELPEWEDVSPFLVIEVLCKGDPRKDLVRNVELYLAVLSIKEYWLLDSRKGVRNLKLRVYRRHGSAWRTSEYAFGETYTTRLLPGFKLVVDPRQ